MVTQMPASDDGLSQPPRALPDCKADADFVCEFLWSAVEHEKWKGMNVVNIGSVLNSKVRRRGHVKPSDLLQDMREMLARWDSMTLGECARLTGMFVSLARKSSVIAEYLDNWHGSAQWGEVGPYPTVWTTVACQRLSSAVQAMKQYWEQQLQQSAATPVTSLPDVLAVSAALEHHGFLKRTLEPLDAAVAKFAATQEPAAWPQQAPTGAGQEDIAEEQAGAEEELEEYVISEDVQC